MPLFVVPNPFIVMVVAVIVVFVVLCISVSVGLIRQTVPRYFLHYGYFLIKFLSSQIPDQRWLVALYI